MTDGPFKNLNLSAPLKKVVETLSNDAYDDDERSGRICHACLKSLVDAGDLALVESLRAKADSKQMELDALSAAEEVFRNHNMTSFADKLQKELACHISHSASLKDAMDQALPSAIRRELQECDYRIQEELVRAQEAGEARAYQVRDAMRDLRRATDVVPLDRLCEAVLKGEARAFKESASKKVGIDQGPSL